MSSRMIPLIVVPLVVGFGLLALLAVRQTHRAAQQAMTYVPTQEDVSHAFPELAIPGTTFSGVWAERDRGTWIFEYGSADSAATLDALRNSLATNGWVLIERFPDDSTMEHFRKPAASAHLLFREQPNGFLVLVILSAKDNLATDEFATRLLRERWHVDRSR